MLLRIAVGQLTSSANLRHNASIVNKLIVRAIKEKAQVLFLPEATDYLAKDAATSIELSKTSHTDFISIVSKKLKEVQKQGNSLYVAVGIHTPNEKGDKVKNVQVLINPFGEITHEYAKIHLFDVEIANGPILKESNSVEAGTELLPPIDFDPFKIGFAICYDIRFPKLALELRKLGANVLTFPSAFTVKTGELHWELLARARAVDTQSYVILAAQAGVHNVGPVVDERKQRISYGESLVVSPWGDVVLRLNKYDGDLKVDEDGDYFELGVVDLDIEKVNEFRQNIPLLKHDKF